MTTKSYKITWSGHNNSSYLQGQRSASTMLSAVRAAIRYGNAELMGEGILTIYADGEVERIYEAGLLAGTPRGTWIRTDRHNR